MTTTTHTATKQSPRADTSWTDRYQRVRTFTESLAEPLSAEDQTVQSMPDASPTKWHRAHVTWFFEEFLLSPSLPTYREFHHKFRYLFNSYYESVGPRHPRPTRGLLSRPNIDEIAQYRRHVDNAMCELLSADLDQETTGLIELGLNHEQQHQELMLMDIKHMLSMNPLRPSYRDHLETSPSIERTPRWIDHRGGLAYIGHDGVGFSFDNEAPRHRTYLEPFALADRPVTCADWLSFIADDGYLRPEFWLSEGWATVLREAWDAPLYWTRDGDEWEIFTIGGPKALDLAEPVCHVSYFEADAYARWAGARLPTEEEWEAVAATHRDTHRGIDLDVLHPRSMRDDSDSNDLGSGQVWEWTSSAYLPYPGFRAAAGAVGEYNGKFMVNQHVLRGGCCVSSSGHIRTTYRNFFPPSARWAFSGVRLAKDL